VRKGRIQSTKFRKGSKELNGTKSRLKEWFRGKQNRITVKKMLINNDRNAKKKWMRTNQKYNKAR
jgi:hypothetical protein